MNVIEHATAVDALARQINKPGVCLPIVNAIGITVNLAALPCWPEYQRARNRHHCGKFKKTMRQFFFPSFNRRIGREFIAAQAKLQNEFINALIEHQAMVEDDS